MNTCKNDHIRLRFSCFLRQAQTITNIICDILNISVLVIVRQDNGVLPDFQVPDCLKQIYSRIDLFLNKAL